MISSPIENSSEKNNLNISLYITSKEEHITVVCKDLKPSRKIRFNVCKKSNSIFVKIIGETK